MCSDLLFYSVMVIHLCYVVFFFVCVFCVYVCLYRACRCVRTAMTWVCLTHVPAIQYPTYHPACVQLCCRMFIKTWLCLAVCPAGIATLAVQHLFFTDPHPPSNTHTQSKHNVSILIVKKRMNNRELQTEYWSSLAKDPPLFLPSAWRLQPEKALKEISWVQAVVGRSYL